MSTVQRIELPDDQWWELDLDPKWGKVKELLAAIANEGEIPNQSEIDFTMIALTTAWSFEAEPSLGALEELRAAYVLPVLQEVMDKILPLFEVMGASV